MDLLLTHPYFLGADLQEQRVMKPYPPLGLLYLSSHLKARGFSVGVFDGTFQSEADFETRLLRDRPSTVGFYCNLTTKLAAIRLIDVCRRADIPVIVGGPDPPFHAEAYLDAGARVVVVGEGEHTLQELLPRLLARPDTRDWADIHGLVYRDEFGAIVRTAARAQIEDLDQQPHPDRAAVDIESYLSAWRGTHGRGSVSLITARGCPYSCTWCSRSVFGQTHRRRSPIKVADEVEEIVGLYHPEMLWYADDVFTIHAGWMHKYADEITRRGLALPFECISRAERIDESIADALKKLGCFRLWIGSESGSQKVLDAMERRVTVERVRAATRLLQSRGIQVGMFIMFGYPGEEVDDIAATIDHLKTSAPDVFLTTVAYPIKGTAFANTVEDRLMPRGPWRTSTDRDVDLRGRPRRIYYDFARRWVTGEVAAHRHWTGGRYLRAMRSLLSAGAGRAGMALTRGAVR